MPRAPSLEAGTWTVIGEPDAKSFRHECLRHLDFAVLECNEALIEDTVAGRFEPHSIVYGPKPYDDTPTLAEREPEGRAFAFVTGRPYAGAMIPVLSSVGCPYTCNFCSDWNSRYRALSTDRLAEDLRNASEHFHGTRLVFHDPNIGTRFDETGSILEQLPEGKRNLYFVECSLKLLNPEWLRRPRDTTCYVVSPRIESWTSRSNRAGFIGSGISRGEDEHADRAVRGDLPREARQVRGIGAGRGERARADGRVGAAAMGHGAGVGIQPRIAAPDHTAVSWFPRAWKVAGTRPAGPAIPKQRLGKEFVESAPRFLRTLNFNLLRVFPRIRIGVGLRGGLCPPLNPLSFSDRV